MTTESKSYLYLPYSGPTLLEMPLLNKGSAFNNRERKSFNLHGLLPPRYESIEEQAERAYMQYSSFSEPLNQHVYLRHIQDTNETLFYYLVRRHLQEMLPIIYTPTVGDACQRFSDIYRSSRGLFLSYSEREHLDDILRNATKRKVKVIVITDGERILGLGDQGIGGMGISIGKLALYTACGGISPAYTMPIAIDVGTNNQTLLNDPRYMGARHERIGQAEYDAFIEKVMAALKHRWPEAMVQFEDFAQPNAMPILNKYRKQYCCFNDDIQGTAAVTIGTLIAAAQKVGKALHQMKFVFVGAGSAGCGIAEMLIKQLLHEGIPDSDARAQVFMIDRLGLLTSQTPGMRDFQRKLAQPHQAVSTWNGAQEFPQLIDVLRETQADVLIGVSGVAGLFSEDAIRLMASYCDKPIIMPLSNPSRNVEAHPENVLQWSEGRAVVATGSPFGKVVYNGEYINIPQCNNSYIFPGIGLGVIAAKAPIITDGMLMAAANALAELSPEGDLLPDFNDIQAVSRHIALAVGRAAVDEGLVLKADDAQLLSRIDKHIWSPVYRDYKRVSF